MKTQIALVMHKPLGAAFLSCAEHILGGAQPLEVFDILPDADPERQTQLILQWILSLAADTPVLILCDLYGATPYNIATAAQSLAHEHARVVHVLTGTNACMVIKAITAAQERPAELGELVRQGALRGITHAPSAPNTNT